MTLGQADNQFSHRQDQHRQNVCDILYRTAIGDQKIINCMKSDGSPESFLLVVSRIGLKSRRDHLLRDLHGPSRVVDEQLVVGFSASCM